MQKVQLDEIKHGTRQFSTPKRLIFIFVGGVTVLVVSFFIFLWGYYSISPSLLYHVARTNTQQLKQHSDRINILVLGSGGQDHDGGDLTDTLLVVSLGINSREMVLISLPRDIWIASFKDKINAAYRYGEEKQSGGGFVLAKSSVEEVTGLPIHYGALIDFAGFTEVIDSVGGIDVAIETSFVDEKYPIKGKENDDCDGDPKFNCRYEIVRFTQGIEHMSGERALVYVRSRHAEGVVGTDYSRGSRQQVVLSSLQNKLMNMDWFENRRMIPQFISIFQRIVKTDMSIEELLIFARIVKNNQSVRSVVLNQDGLEKGVPGLFINPPLLQYDGKWVLIPKADSFDTIHEYIRCVIDQKVECEKLID